MTSVVPYNSQSQVPVRIEFSPEQIQVIKNTICRGATDHELGLFLATCRRTGLDPFLKQIHAVVRSVNVGTRQAPKYEKQMQIQVGIDGYRVLRDRITDSLGSPLFDGMEGPQWSEDGEHWLDYPYSVKPKYARVAIYRKGISRPFVAVCRWEAYNQANPMWDQMGPEQLAKCAEALALRRTFPAEMCELPSGPIADVDPLTEGERESMPVAVQALIESEPEAVEGDFSEAPPAPEPVISHEQYVELSNMYSALISKEARAEAHAAVLQACPYADKGNGNVHWMALLEADFEGVRSVLSHLVDAQQGAAPTPTAPRQGRMT